MDILHGFIVRSFKIYTGGMVKSCLKDIFHLHGFF